MNWLAQILMRLPSFAAAYVAAAMVFGLWWFRGERGKVLLPLSGVLLAVAGLNGYAEQWGNLSHLRFQDAGVILVGGFLLPYSILCVRLMERAGIARGGAAFVSSFLPFVYLLALGLLLNLRQMPTADNPAFSLYIFLIFMCALHIPAFAFGKNRAIRAQSKLEDLQIPHSGGRTSLLRQVIAALGTPLLIVLIFQTLAPKDWTLFFSERRDGSGPLLAFLSL